MNIHWKLWISLGVFFHWTLLWYFVKIAQFSVHFISIMQGVVGKPASFALAKHWTFICYTSSNNKLGVWMEILVDLPLMDFRKLNTTIRMHYFSKALFAYSYWYSYSALKIPVCTIVNETATIILTPSPNNGLLHDDEFVPILYISDASQLGCQPLQGIQFSWCLHVLTTPPHTQIHSSLPPKHPTHSVKKSIRWFKYDTMSYTCTI